jgi:membrane protein involved in colicin uptake
MAKPNYSFEKRQRELAKKKKKEEKLKEKAERKAGDPVLDEVVDEVGSTDAAPVEGQPPAP